MVQEIIYSFERSPKSKIERVDLKILDISTRRQV